MQRPLVIVFLAVFTVLGCDRGAPQGEPAPTASHVPSLGERFAPLAADFDAAAAKVRVVALLSPT